MTAPAVVVVGDVGVDVLVRPSGPVVLGGDIPSQVTRVAGGAGANSAAWLAAYDVPVALVGRVGRDPAGREARALLEDDGVCAVLAEDEHRPTCTVVVVANDGERTMLSDRGASGALVPADIDLDAAARALGQEPAHLHLSGFVLLSEATRAAGVAALQRARARGWSTSVDPAAANLVAAMSGSAIWSLVTGVDLLLPNAAELEALGGARAALRCATEVVVTHGPAGATWTDGSEQVHREAPSVVCADTTGCGDAFNAGFLSVRLAGGSPLEALTAGVMAGSRCVSGLGGRPVR